MSGHIAMWQLSAQVLSSQSSELTWLNGAGWLFLLINKKKSKITLKVSKMMPRKLELAAPNLKNS